MSWSRPGCSTCRRYCQLFGTDCCSAHCFPRRLGNKTGKVHNRSLLFSIYNFYKMPPTDNSLDLTNVAQIYTALPEVVCVGTYIGHRSSVTQIGYVDRSHKYVTQIGHLDRSKVIGYIDRLHRQVMQIGHVNGLHRQVTQIGYVDRSHKQVTGDIDRSQVTQIDYIDRSQATQIGHRSHRQVTYRQVIDRPHRQVTQMGYIDRSQVTQIGYVDSKLTNCFSIHLHVFKKFIIFFIKECEYCPKIGQRQ